MIKWEIVTVELSAEKLEYLSRFWRGGYGNAIGFRVGDVGKSYGSKARKGQRIVKAKVGK